MEKIKITSSQNNEYYYDDASGFIYPSATAPMAVQNHLFQKEARADAGSVGEYLFSHGFRQLLLEVTQGCNLRCRYCTYSEHYESTRSHGCSMMPAETAIAAVDYYMSNFDKVSYKNPMRNPRISFYGGEPLLNIELIRTVVSHVKEQYPEFTIEYNMTTNGLLLTAETGDFLAEHGFSVIVSLDGDQENHDRNRRRADGTGSFQQVFGNIQLFRKRHPDYGKFGVSACMDYRTDLEAIAAFFEKNKIFVTTLNMVSDNETDYYEDFTEEDRERFRKQMARLKKRYLALAKKEGILISEHPFLLTLFGLGYVEMTFHSLISRGRPECLPCTGSCIPGEKIYVTINGDYHMCERISPHFPIGEVRSGLNLETIAVYLNEFNQFSPKCKKCNISRMCNICIARSTEAVRIVEPEDSCVQRERNIRHILKEYVDLMESKQDQMEQVIVSYYKELKAVAGDTTC